MIVQQSSQAQLQNPPQVEMRFLSSCHYKGEGVVLDMQYNHDGSLLAIACSNGELCIYDLVQDNKKTPLCCFKDHKGGILKLTWSLPQLGRYLASCSIDKSINVYEINVEGNTRRHCIQLNCIPVSMAFCPWDEKLVLVVGLSNGELQVYGEDFEGSSTVPDAHLMSINCVSWSNEIVVSNQRIQWVKKTLTNVEIYMPNDTLPLLATVSSDRKLHIWRIDLDSLKLFKVAETVAHEK
jgi:WD40 repeat protein